MDKACTRARGCTCKDCAEGMLALASLRTTPAFQPIQEMSLVSEEVPEAVINDSSSAATAAAAAPANTTVEDTQVPAPPPSRAVNDSVHDASFVSAYSEVDEAIAATAALAEGRVTGGDNARSSGDTASEPLLESEAPALEPSAVPIVPDPSDRAIRGSASGQYSIPDDSPAGAAMPTHAQTQPRARPAVRTAGSTARNGIRRPPSKPEAANADVDTGVASPVDVAIASMSVDAAAMTARLQGEGGAEAPTSNPVKDGDNRVPDKKAAAAALAPTSEAGGADGASVDAATMTAHINQANLAPKKGSKGVISGSSDSSPDQLEMCEALTRDTEIDERPIRPTAAAEPHATAGAAAADEPEAGGGAHDAFATIPLTDRLVSKTPGARRSAYAELAGRLSSPLREEAAWNIVCGDGGIGMLRHAINEGTPLPLDAGVVLLRAVLQDSVGRAKISAVAVDFAGILIAKAYGANKSSTSEAAAEATALLASSCASPKAVLDLVIAAMKNLKGPAKKAVPTACKAIAQMVVRTSGGVDISAAFEMLPTLLMSGTDRSIIQAATELARIVYAVHPETFGAVLARHAGESGIQELTMNGIRDASAIPAALQPVIADLAAARAARPSAAPAAAVAAANFNDLPPEEQREIELDNAYAASSEIMEISSAMLREVKLSDAMKGSWRDKADALTRFLAIICKYPKVSVAGLTDFIGLLSRVMQEPNVVVVDKCCDVLAQLASRMHERFAAYAGQTLRLLIEKLKEKRNSAPRTCIRTFVRVDALPVEMLVEDLRPIILTSKSPEHRSNSLDVLLSLVSSTRHLRQALLTGPTSKERLNGIVGLLADACVREPSIDVRHLAERGLGALVARLGTERTPGLQHPVLAAAISRIEEENSASAERVRSAAGLSDASTVAATTMNTKVVPSAPVPRAASSATAQASSVPPRPAAAAPPAVKSAKPPQAPAALGASKARARSGSTTSLGSTGAPSRAANADRAAVPRADDAAASDISGAIMSLEDVIEAYSSSALSASGAPEPAALDVKSIPEKRAALDALFAAAAGADNPGSVADMSVALAYYKSLNFKSLSNPAMLAAVTHGVKALARACRDPHRFPPAVGVFLVEQLAPLAKERKAAGDIEAMLFALAYAIGPRQVARTLCNVLVAAKIQPAQVAVHELLANLVCHVGAHRMDVASVVEAVCGTAGVQSSAPPVRAAAHKVLHMLYTQMGPNLLQLLGKRRMNLTDDAVKAVTKHVQDAVTYSAEAAARIAADAEAPYGETEAPAVPAVAASSAATSVPVTTAAFEADCVDLALLVPRSLLAQMEEEAAGVPVVAEGSSAAAAAAAAASAEQDASAKPWQKRLDALTTANTALDVAIQRCQQLPAGEHTTSVIKVVSGRLRDANANVRATACAVIARLARLAGPVLITPYVRTIAEHLLMCLSDKKSIVSTAAFEAMDALVTDAPAGGIAVNVNVHEVFHTVATVRVLVTTASVREELLKWMCKYAGVLTLATNVAVMHELLPGIVQCVLDKTPGPRKAASDFLPHINRLVSQKKIRDMVASMGLRQAAVDTVLEALAKMPVEASAGAKPVATAATTASSAGAKPSTVAASVPAARAKARGPSPTPATATLGTKPVPSGTAAVSAEAAHNAKLAAYALYRGDTRRGRKHRLADKSMFRPWIDVRSATGLWLDLVSLWRKCAYSNTPLAEDMFGPDGKCVVDERVTPPLMWLRQQYGYWTARMVGTPSMPAGVAPVPLDCLENSFDLQLKYIGVVLCVGSSNANVVKAATECLDAMFSCTKIVQELPLTRFDVGNAIPCMLHAMETGSQLNRSLILTTLYHFIDGLPGQSDDDELTDSWLTLRGFMRNFMTREIKGADRPAYKAQLLSVVAFLVEKHSVGRLVLPDNLLQLVITQTTESKDKAVLDAAWKVLSSWFTSPHHLNCSADSFFLKLSRCVTDAKRREPFKLRVNTWLKERKLPAADWPRIEAALGSDPLACLVAAAQPTDSMETEHIIPDDEMAVALGMDAVVAAAFEDTTSRRAAPSPSSPENVKENDELGASRMDLPSASEINDAVTGAIPMSTLTSTASRALRALEAVELPVELAHSVEDVALLLGDCPSALFEPAVRLWQVARHAAVAPSHEMPALAAAVQALRAAVATTSGDGGHVIPNPAVQSAVCSHVNVLLAMLAHTQHIACGQSYCRSKAERGTAGVDQSCIWETSSCIFDIVRNQAAARRVSVEVADLLLTESLLRSSDKRLVDRVTSGPTGADVNRLVSRLIMRLLWNVPKEVACIAMLRMLRRLATAQPFPFGSQLRHIDPHTVANTCQLLLRVALYATETWSRSKTDTELGSSDSGWRGVDVAIIVAAIDVVLNEPSVQPFVEPLLWIPEGDPSSRRALAAAQDASLSRSPASKIHHIAATPGAAADAVFTHPRTSFPIEPRSDNPIVAYGRALGLDEAGAFQTLQPVVSAAEFLCELIHPFGHAFAGHLDDADVLSTSVTRKIVTAELARVAAASGVSVAEVQPFFECQSRMLDQMQKHPSATPARSRRPAAAATPLRTGSSPEVLLDPRARILAAVASARSSSTPPAPGAAERSAVDAATPRGVGRATSMLDAGEDASACASRILSGANAFSKEQLKLAAEHLCAAVAAHGSTDAHREHFASAVLSTVEQLVTSLPKRSTLLSLITQVHDDGSAANALIRHARLAVAASAKARSLPPAAPPASMPAPPVAAADVAPAFAAPLPAHAAAIPSPALAARPVDAHLPLGTASSGGARRLSGLSAGIGPRKVAAKPAAQPAAMDL